MSDKGIKEKLNIDCSIENLIDVWMYNIKTGINVFNVTFLCKKLNLETENLKVSEEYKAFGLFNYEEIEKLNISEGYKNSIKKAIQQIC